MYGPFTLYGTTFQTLPLYPSLSSRGPTTPPMPKHRRFGLFPVRSPLLGESLVYFLLLGVIRCFSSPRLPPFYGYTAFNRVGCPIRKSPDQWLFAPSRCLSQLITSFFASESLGIRHAPLLTSFLCGLLSSREVGHVSYVIVSLLYLLYLQRTTCQRSLAWRSLIDPFRAATAPTIRIGGDGLAAHGPLRLAYMALFCGE